MKVVFASTPEQATMIQELVQNMYTEIFPQYFSDDEIKEFERLNVLHTSAEYLDTLREAYQVIASLQALIAILESPQPDARYEGLFDKNAQTLEEFGLSFPFTFSHFCGIKMIKEEMLSIYSKAANELII